jgi:hypothetical protein
VALEEDIPAPAMETRRSEDKKPRYKPQILDVRRGKINHESTDSGNYGCSGFGETLMRTSWPEVERTRRPEK